MYLDDLSRLGAPEFADRVDAGHNLARKLVENNVQADIVLGLTRGGVPVAAGVARELALPLDVIVVKKVGTPFNEELAMGAVCADGSLILNQDFIRQMRLSDRDVERMVREKLDEAVSAESNYRHGGPPPDLEGKSVVIVDDGIATGATVEAAVSSARNRGATQAIVAAPVASPESASRLARIADHVISVLEPSDFFGVGQFYRDFSQVEDDEVRRLLAEHRNAPVR